MTFNIPLRNTAKFYNFLKQKSNDFDDFEFVTQSQYFDELVTRASVEECDLQGLFDAHLFWKCWLDDTNALKMYMAMVAELSCCILYMDKYDVNIKIKEEL